MHNQTKIQHSAKIKQNQITLSKMKKTPRKITDSSTTEKIKRNRGKSKRNQVKSKQDFKNGHSHKTK